jgi:hypothetical protein
MNKTIRIIGWIGIYMISYLAAGVLLESLGLSIDTYTAFALPAVLFIAGHHIYTARSKKASSVV